MVSDWDRSGTGGAGERKTAALGFSFGCLGPGEVKP